MLWIGHCEDWKRAEFLLHCFLLRLEFTSSFWKNKYKQSLIFWSRVSLQIIVLPVAELNLAPASLCRSLEQKDQVSARYPPIAPQTTRKAVNLGQHSECKVLPFLLCLLASSESELCRLSQDLQMPPVCWAPCEEGLVSVKMNWLWTLHSFLCHQGVCCSKQETPVDVNC